MPELITNAYGPTLTCTLFDAFGSLRALGLRSLLALLAIMLGCASVIALVNIGHNAASETMRNFRDMGSGSLMASFADSESRPVAITLDIPAIQRAIPALKHLAPLSISYLRARNGAQSTWATVIGSTTDFAPAIGLRIAAGRFLSNWDGKSTFAVLGAQLAKDLSIFPTTHGLDSQVQVGRYLYEVVGIADSVPEGSLLPVTINTSIIVPIEGIARLRPNPQVDHLFAKADTSAGLGNVALALRTYFTQQIGHKNISVLIPQQLLEGMQRQARTFSYLLAALGGIALLMGGAGVMNVMLISIFERRQEIGLRMALGARRKDIGLLFLFEAAGLSIAGGLCGVVVGVFAAYLFTWHVGWAFALHLWCIPIGVGCAILTGLVFGLYPALAAAQLQPVAALRDA